VLLEDAASLGAGVRGIITGRFSPSGSSTARDDIDPAKESFCQGGTELLVDISFSGAVDALGGIFSFFGTFIMKTVGDQPENQWMCRKIRRLIEVL
jgi:hypothetical protein